MALTSTNLSVEVIGIATVANLLGSTIALLLFMYTGNGRIPLCQPCVSFMQEDTDCTPLCHVYIAFVRATRSLYVFFLWCYTAFMRAYDLPKSNTTLANANLTPLCDLEWDNDLKKTNTNNH